MFETLKYPWIFLLNGKGARIAYIKKSPKIEYYSTVTQSSMKRLVAKFQWVGQKWGRAPILQPGGEKFFTINFWYLFLNVTEILSCFLLFVLKCHATQGFSQVISDKGLKFFLFSIHGGEMMGSQPKISNNLSSERRCTEFFCKFSHHDVSKIIIKYSPCVLKRWRGNRYCSTNLSPFQTG